MAWLSFFLYFVYFVGPLLCCFYSHFRHNVPYFLYHSMQLHVDPLLHISVAQVVWQSVVIALISSIGSMIIACLLVSLQLVSSTILVRSLVQSVVLFPYIFGNVVSGMLCVKGATMFSYSSYSAIIVSHLLLHYPFVYRFILMQWYAYPFQLNKLARSLGASSLQIFYTVTASFLCVQHCMQPAALLLD